LHNPAQVETVEKAFARLCHVILAHVRTFTQELPRFNQKRREKGSTAKRQPYQPKPVAVETQQNTTLGIGTLKIKLFPLSKTVTQSYLTLVLLFDVRQFFL